MKILRNRILLGFFITCLCLCISCQKEANMAFPLEKSFADPDSILQHYQSIIEEAEHGFEFMWDAKANGFYAGYIDFKNQNEADFMMDVFPTKGDIQYKLKVVDKKPTLSLIGGSTYETLKPIWDQLDTSYSILHVSADTVMLRGNKFGNMLKLIPINTIKKQAYMNGGMQRQIETMANIQKLPKYFKRLYYNGGYYDLHFNPEWRKIYIHYGLVDRFKIFECSYAHTASGIQLQQTFTDDANSISNIEISLNLETQLLKARINDREYPFSNEESPSAINPQAIFDFYNHPNNSMNLNLGNNTLFPQYFSASLTGFTVAGLEDAYGISSVPQFAYLALFQSWINNEYGTMKIFFNNSSLSDYGPAFTAEYVPEIAGIRYSYYGSFSEIPDNVKPALDPTISSWLNPNGFYVIKSGPASYDLVSYDTNPQVWISFQ